MSSLCDTNCGAAPAVPPTYDADCIVSTAKAGAEHFFLIKCDEAVDMTDMVAVAAAVTSGVITKSPRGKLLINRGENDVVEDAFGCGDDMELGYSLALNYETYMAEDSTVADDTYWAALNDNYNAYRAFWVTCSGKAFIDQGADNPGFKFGLPARFLPENGEKNYVKWTGELALTNLTSSIIPVYDEALLTALGVGI